MYIYMYNNIFRTLLHSKHLNIDKTEPKIFKNCFKN